MEHPLSHSTAPPDMSVDLGIVVVVFVGAGKMKADRCDMGAALAGVVLEVVPVGAEPVHDRVVTVAVVGRGRHHLVSLHNRGTP